MNGQTYKKIENYMTECMTDAAHDREHVYRVLYAALDIASTLQNVDRDVLIAACLLHDIGRAEQFKDRTLDHAEVGAVKARAFLTGIGFDGAFADRVADCIVTHRFRKDNKPRTIEAKILFDADKLDVTGAMGIARTLMYKAGEGEPLYSIGADGLPSNGENDEDPSFFAEYCFKLKNLYNRFYTERARVVAAGREQAAKSFYSSLYSEVAQAYAAGKILGDILSD